MFSRFCQEIKANQTTVFKVYILAFLIFLSAKVIGKLVGLGSYELISDPAEVAGLSPYIGLISNLGILCWTASASICIFLAFITYAIEDLHRQWFLFFMASGIFSIWLTLDDLLQLHEAVGEFLADLPILHHAFDANLLEGVDFLIYFGLFIAYVIYFRKHFRKTECSFLVLAFVMFALSIIIDTLIPDNGTSWKYLVEKLPKFLGIVSWMIYFSRTGIMLINKHLLLSRSTE